MLLTKNRKVGNLEEDLQEMGLNPKKFLGATHRMTDLMEGRTQGGEWKGTPPIARYGRGPQGAAHVEEERQLHEVDGDPGDGVETLTEEDLHEVERSAMGIRSRSARMVSRQQATRARRADPEKMKATREKKIAGRRSSVKRKKARKRKKVRRSVSAKKHKALNRAGFRVGLGRFDGKPAEEAVEEMDTILDEDTEYQAALEAFEAIPDDTPFFDAACKVEEIAMHFERLFDLAEETEAARVMGALAEHARTLAEDIDGLETLDEDQDERLKDVLGQTAKAIRFYEAMGEPSLSEAVAYAEHRESQLAEAGGDDDDDDLSEVVADDEVVEGDGDFEEVPPGDGGGGSGNGDLAEV